jgi:hypothetical protein
LARLPTATASDGKGHRPYKRKLSNYLLDKSLQLRYVAFVTVLSAIISGSLGFMIWRQGTQASSKIMETVDTMCEDEGADCRELQEAISADLSRRDTYLTLKMVGVGVGLVLVLSLYLVVMTHKVAGPLYKVSTYFDKMADGKLGEVYPLRKGDMMQDFYEKFREMHIAVRERHRADNEGVARFLAACDAAGVAREGELGQALDALARHREERDAALA